MDLNSLTMWSINEQCLKEAYIIKIDHYKPCTNKVSEIVTSFTNIVHSMIHVTDNMLSQVRQVMSCHTTSTHVEMISVINIYDFRAVLPVKVWKKLNKQETGETV